LLLVTLLCGAVLAIALSASPRSTPYPSRDSGVYLYTAARVLEGQIPYRDVWDHKGPGVYYLDAAALRVGRDSLWGVWALETMAWLAAMLLGFNVLRRAFGLGPAAVGSVAWLGGLVLTLEHGEFNMPETYALPFQFGALWLVYDAERVGRYGWRSVLLGAAAAACFLLKPNLIALTVAVVLVLAVTRTRGRRRRVLLADMASITAGAVVPLALVAGYFIWHRALDDLVDQMFRYNFAYAGNRSLSVEGLTELLLTGSRTLSQSGLPVLIVAGWAAGVATARLQPLASRRLTQIVLVAGPIELGLLLASGRARPHYFTSWLPIAAVLIAVITALLARGVAAGATDVASPALRTTWVLSGLALAVAIGPAARLGQALHEPPGEWERTLAATVEYLESRTEHRDYVLIWGTEASINFMAGRPSPTRYVYQLPLYTRGYSESDQVAEFLGDLQRNPPAIIVDVSADDPRFPPIDPEARASWTPTLDHYGAAYVPLPEMDTVLDYLNDHYRPVKVPGPEEATGTKQRVRQLIREVHAQGFVVYERRRPKGGAN
jgi:hypothetical protein